MPLHVYQEDSLDICQSIVQLRHILNRHGNATKIQISSEHDAIFDMRCIAWGAVILNEGDSFVWK